MAQGSQIPVSSTPQSNYEKGSFGVKRPSGPHADLWPVCPEVPETLGLLKGQGPVYQLPYRGWQ